MNRWFCLLSTSLILINSLLFGSDDIERITVIADQRYLTPEKTSAHVSLITAEEIRASGARNIGELLDSVVGAYVQNYGAFGSYKALSIRGSSSEQVLVLVNGKRLNTAQGGGVDLATIDPENIERIEIIRGSASTVYGENALGGVINIITRSGEKNSAVNAYYAYGSFATHMLGFNLSGALAEKKYMDYYFGFRGLLSQGGYLFTDQEKGTVEQRKNTGITAGDLDMRMGLDMGQQRNHRLTASLQMHKDEKGVPGMVNFPTVSASMNEERMIGMLDYDYYNFPFLSRSILNASVYSVFQKREFTDPDFFLGKIDDHHDNKAWGTDVSLDSHLPVWIYQRLHLGYAYRWDWLTSTGLEKSPGVLEEGEVSRSAHSFIFLDELHFFQYRTGNGTGHGRIVLIPGLRYDLNSLYEDVTSQQIGLLLNFDQKRRFIIKANMGTAYRAPSFDDLFWPQTAFAVGNPELKPEKSYNWDTGITAKLYQWLSAEIVYYHSEVNDLIQWYPGPGGIWRPDNVARVILQGIETEVKSIWLLRFIKSYLEVVYNYALMLATDKSGQPATEGKQLPGRPFEKANLIVSLQRPEKYFVRWETRFVGFRYLTAHNTKYLDAYVVHDLNTGICFFSHYELSFQVINLFNEEYIDIRGYPVPGREYMLKAGVRF